MQPFGRPVARAIVSQANLGLLASSRFRTPLKWGPRVQSAFTQPTTPRLHGSWRRFSSLPPKPPNEATNSSPKSLEEDRPFSTVEDAGNRATSSPEEPSNGKLKPDLPSTLDRRRSELNHKFSELMDNVQSRVLTASQTLNEMTGYSSIETIKAENAALEASLADAQARVRAARHAYKSSNSKRAATQREVTTLLARKESWSPSDLERFTELYRTDHTLEHEVTSAQESLTEAEAEEQSLSQKLNNGILKRYHEEQIWSDRIRRASTWGTWGLMGMNFLLFVVIQFFAEPWKRRRLVKGVVAEEKAVLDEVRSELVALKEVLQQRVDEQLQMPQREEPAVVATTKEEILEAIDAAVEPELEYVSPWPWKESGESIGAQTTLLDAWRDFLLDPERWRLAFHDLFSDRRLDFRMKDASTLALEGALAGATVAGSIVWILIRRS